MANDRRFRRDINHVDDDNEMMGEGKLIDIACEILVTTPKAYRLYDGATTEWVPKSQCQNNGDGTVTMSEWIAKEKGFI